MRAVMTYRVVEISDICEIGTFSNSGIFHEIDWEHFAIAIAVVR